MKMLAYCTRLCVSVLIVLALCQVLTSYKPIISPSSKEIIIDEGEALEISCVGYSSTTINFVFPEINTSSYSIRDDLNNLNNIHNTTFTRPKTVFSDTGWYGCADHNVEITNFYDPEVNWLYVYVKSNRSAFVEVNTNAHLNVTAGGNIIIPCRTTLPFLRPILINDKGDKLKKASYEPKIGFTIRNSNNSNSYKCLVNTLTDNKEYTVNYTLSVHRAKQILTEPKVIGNYFIYGHNLHVNCTIEIEIFMQYVFDWNTPQQNSSRRSTQQFKKHLDTSTVLATSQLTIFNVTEEDSGDYECVVRINYGNKITQKIMIPSHQMKSTDFNIITNYYKQKSGSAIYWDVAVSNNNITTYLNWFKPNGEEIVQSPKYSISTDNIQMGKDDERIMTNLKIRSLNVLDSGNYTLQKKNQYVMKYLNVKLDVIDKPIFILISIDSYYPYNKSTEFRCEVISNPPPNITWNFLKYPNYPSLENSIIIHLMNTTLSVANNSNYIFESIATMLIEAPGKMTCEACNEVGCDSMTENVLVSDGLGAFGIIGPKELVVKGDDVQLICAASIYNYTDEFTWTVLINQTEQPLEETERLKTVKYNTPFTHRSILKLNNVQESDAKDYFCIGKIMNTLNHEALYPLPDRGNYKLIIYDPVPPFFVKTNMNKTKTRIIDVITESHYTIILQCYVDGMPKPIVTWYKDYILLTKNDQYLFKNNYQELHITYFMQYDSGKYSCRAISRLGINEIYQQIIVKNTKWNTLDVVLITSIPILSLILIILAIAFAIKIHREKKMKKESIDVARLNFEEGAVESLNPNLTVDDQTELLPYDKNWEFPRERLKLREQLGSGNFGIVMKAEAIGISKNENVTTVAVKMIHGTTNPIYEFRTLASELKIMVHLGKHLNIINLLGACTKNISKCELLMIVEYCRFGNLRNYLLRHRNNFINQINHKTGKYDFTIGMDILTRTVNDHSRNINSDIDVTVHCCPETNLDSPKNFLPDCVLSSNLSQPELKLKYCNDCKNQNPKPICTQDLLSWAFQVARGMEYVSQKKILHGDLAARNILLAEDNVVKICDFGLAKTIYKNGNYKKRSKIPVPIKWMAIESIRDRIFSTQSDVWSFGIVLWELFTLAETPYPGMDAEKQYQKLIEDYRMEQPDYAIDEIYNIMLQCWIAKPTLRPTFTDLVESIGNVLEESVRMHYITLNNKYMDINMMNLKNRKDDYLMMMSAPDYAVLSLPIYKCLNSLSKETTDPSHLHMRSGCPPNEFKIFGSRSHEDYSNIELLPLTSNSVDATDLPLKLKHEKDLSEIDSRAKSKVRAIKASDKGPDDR